MVRRRHLFQIGNIRQRLDTLILTPGHYLYTLHHEGAVDTNEGHHVSNSSKCYQIEPLHQIGLFQAGIREIPGVPQTTVQCNQKQKGHSHRRQLSAHTCLVEAIRINNGHGLWKTSLCHMVIKHHNVETGRFGVG